MWQEVSTASVPAEDRFAWFSETVSSSLMPSAFIPEDFTDFHADGAVLDLGIVHLSKFQYSPLRSRRTPSLIRRGDPEQYQIGLVTSGAAWFAQSGNEVRLGPREMVVWDTSKPYESMSGLDGVDTEVFVLQIPKAIVPVSTSRVDRLLARRMSGEAGLSAVLADFMISLADRGPGCQKQELGAMGRVAFELASSWLALQLGADAELSAETADRVLLCRINTFIEQNLADPDLSPRHIAEHHHISLRTLYALFEAQNESVAGSVRRQRLEGCRRDLARPDLPDGAVQTIAARWGLTGGSAFSRMFRTAYGVTPTEYRRQALGRTGRSERAGRAGRN